MNRSYVPYRYRGIPFLAHAPYLIYSSLFPNDDFDGYNSIYSWTTNIPGGIPVEFVFPLAPFQRDHIRA